MQRAYVGFAAEQWHRLVYSLLQDIRVTRSEGPHPCLEVRATNIGEAGTSLSIFGMNHWTHEAHLLNEMVHWRKFDLTTFYWRWQYDIVMSASMRRALRSNFFGPRDVGGIERGSAIDDRRYACRFHDAPCTWQVLVPSRQILGSGWRQQERAEDGM